MQTYYICWGWFRCRAKVEACLCAGSNQKVCGGVCRAVRTQERVAFWSLGTQNLVEGAALQQQFDKFTEAYIAGKIPGGSASFSKRYPGPFTAQLGYISHNAYDFVGIGGTEIFADAWNGIVHEKYGMPLMGDHHRKQLSLSDESLGITVSEKQHRMLCLMYARDYCCIAPLAASIPPACMGPGESTDPVAWCKTAADAPKAYAWLQ